MKFLLYFVLDLEAQVYLFYATEKKYAVEIWSYRVLCHFLFTNSLCFWASKLGGVEELPNSTSARRRKSFSPPIENS